MRKGAALGQKIIFAHKPLNVLGIHQHALPPQGRCHPPIAIVAVPEADALDRIVQLALIRLVAASGQVPVVGRARQACEAAKTLHIGL